MTPDEELLMAVREAITDTSGAGLSADEVATQQATAAVEAMARLGYFKAAGTEYAMRRDGVTEEHGFNTELQARQWVRQQPVPDEYQIEYRPVGSWRRTTDRQP